ncbi:3-deoxy-manno-octulosonate cytidylyltransferase [Candidatus Kapabacteria bacterium]|nr:3-deoxy-manno-octulosonate cytidylyltransferase [Candidatus Kapabacteria bacterium]
MDFKNRELDAIAIIPARLSSTRLAQKMLHPILGKPLIAYAIENAKKSKYIRRVVCATDSEEIKEVAIQYGAEVVITSKNIQTGTDRIAKAYVDLDETADIIFNIQGDEPLLDSETLDTLFEKFSHSLCHVGTLVKKIDNKQDLFNPNVVKATLEIDSSALYFSRSPIPYLRGVDESSWISKHNFWKHIGVYAYRDTALKAFTELPQTDLEIAESLEQLRLLQNNYKYFCVETTKDFHGVDTIDDVKRVENILSNG